MKKVVKPQYNHAIQGLFMPELVFFWKDESFVPRQGRAKSLNGEDDANPGIRIFVFYLGVTISLSATPLEVSKPSISQMMKLEQ